MNVYLNGDYLDDSEARISIFDRGFMFGDGVYEVIPVYGGRLFRFDQHLVRLRHSLDAIALKILITDEQLTDIFNQLLDGGTDDASIYLQITRGAAPRNHSFPATQSPTVLAYAQDLVYPDEAQRNMGVRAVTQPDQRWQRCDIKSVSLLANVLARQYAAEHDALEAILTRDGYITEGAASTMFMVKDDQLLTPPNGHAILPGITRDLIVEIAAANDLECNEVEIPEQDLYSAQEIWLASSTKEVLPVTVLNGQPVADGKPGEQYQQMIRLYDDFKQRFRQGLTA
ncbi:MAG TPA: D-amino acid aminotransferase [Gammaproteobacteria bacterium]|nr:D-amino acid aminotransferase [Gammaproteobacteria bacterium]